MDCTWLRLFCCGLRAVVDRDLAPSWPGCSKSFRVSLTMSGAGSSFSATPVRIPEVLRLWNGFLRLAKIRSGH